MSGIFLKILNMSISALWLVFAVLILRLVLKNAPKWIRVILWAVVAIRLVCPFSFESVLSLMPSGETISKVQSAPRPYFESGIPIVDSQVNDYLGGHYFEGVTRPAGYFEKVTAILTVLWIIGIFALIIYSVFSFLKLKSKVSTAVLLENNVYQSENIASPFVFGIIKPKIYLPFSIDKKDAQQVIAHEKAHICRKDHIFKPLGFLILILHWFNPIIWIGYILFCRDIELACDEKVIKNLDTEHKADYSQALLSCSVKRRTLSACPLAFGEANVRNRIKSVLSYKKPAVLIVLVSVTASIILALCFLTNPVSKRLCQIEGFDLKQRTAKSTAAFGPDGKYLGAIEKDELFRLYDLKVSANPVSESTAENSDKISLSFNLMPTFSEQVMTSFADPIYINFSSDFTQVWISEGSIATNRYKVAEPQKAKEIYSDITDTDFSKSTFGGVDGPEKIENSKAPISKLDEAIKKAINDKYRLERHDGPINVENYCILAHETASGTPLNGESGHFQKSTVYLIVYRMLYSAQGDRLEEVEGEFIPTAITFDIDGSGEYAWVEYWTPSDANYEKDIREKFPANSADEALNIEKYAEGLIKNSWEIASEYLKNKK